MSQLLQGVRVIDLGTRIAAPFCAGLLGEQGAEVIKVEQPRGGDFMREIGPFAESADGPYSLFWAVEGRGRKSVTIDLRRPEGQEIYRRLAASADVVVENFRPGTLEQWNIGPTACDPRLVTVRISMFGQDGPNKARPGLDRVGIGYGGLLHLTGYPDRPPVRVGVTISDYLTGVFAAQAAVSALYARDARGGSGVVIDAALYGAALRVLEWTLAAYDRLGTVRNREGNRLANSAPLDNYPTARREVRVHRRGLGHELRAALQGDGPTRPRRPIRATRSSPIGPPSATRSTASSPRGRRRSTRPRSKPRCVAHDVPVATAYTAADIFADPHMQHRHDLVTVDDPVIGPIRQQAPFPASSGERPEPPSGAPKLGAHTREVLGALGVTASELADLAAKGVV